MNVVLFEGRNNIKIPGVSEQSSKQSGQLPVSILVSEQLRKKITGDKAAVVTSSSFLSFTTTNALNQLDETLVTIVVDKDKKGT